MSHTPHKIDAVDATSIDASIGANCSMLESEHRDSEEGIEDEYDISDSPNTSAAFLEASMVMTLAERFNMTRFEHFQRKVIFQHFCPVKIALLCIQLVVANLYVFSSHQCLKAKRRL